MICSKVMAMQCVEFGKVMNFASGLNYDRQSVLATGLPCLYSLHHDLI